MKPLIVEGKYNTAFVYASIVDETTLDQIQTFVDSEVSSDSHIVIMPDCHAGAGCVIGLTMTLGGWVVPNLVGVDIGCGVLAVKLETPVEDFSKLDGIIRENIPYGFNVRDKQFSDECFDWIANGFDWANIIEVSSRVNSDANRNCLALGSLGGGNHFIEIDVDENGKQWLIVHTGSRKFGYDIARFYQNIAKDTYGKAGGLEGFRNLTAVSRVYLTEAREAQVFAELNRWVIAVTIARNLKTGYSDWIHSIHNYIDFKHDPPILRKGAISATSGEPVIIPLNMKDGCIIGKGKGLLNWNYSAPHGAGRVMGRREAKHKLDVNDFTATMKGVWSSCISEKTLDEAPMAYKPAASIISGIEESVEITHRLKPVYVFKAD